MTTQRKRIPMNLPVKLTPDELRARGAELAKCYSEREIEELHKKIVAASTKEKIDRINAKAKIIVEALRTQKEDREVECVEEIDFTKKVANTYRTDTEPWELVASRGLSREELQLTFKGDPAEVPADAKEEPLTMTEEGQATGEAVGGVIGATIGTVTGEAVLPITEELQEQLTEPAKAPVDFADPTFGTVDPLDEGKLTQPVSDDDPRSRSLPEADPLPDTPDTKPGASVVDMKRPRKAKSQ